MVQPTQIRIDADAYYQLPEYEQHDLIQLIDGEVVIGMPPILKHQDIVREILFFLTLIMRRKGGKAYASPIEVYLDKNNVFEPDVLYVKPDSQCVLEEKRLIGALDLVVEVLSPGTAKYDKQQKFEAYERHGVSEYWIVDPVHDVVDVWALDSDGQFKRHGSYVKADTFKSAVLAEDVPLKDIFNV